MPNKPRALMLASVASMIDLFNDDNIECLLELGCEVDVATNFESGSITSQERVDAYRQELTQRGIRTYQIPIPRSIAKIGSILRSYRLVKKLVRENVYQIVHCHSPIGGVICRLACRKSRKQYGTKVIYTAHGFHFFKGASKKAWLIYYPVEKLCSRFTDVCITINSEDYEAAQKMHAKRNCFVHGIGIHSERFERPSGSRELLRTAFGFLADDYVFMSTGQLSVRKNQSAVIHALAKIADKRVKYLVIGAGELGNSLHRLAEELKVADRVIFAGYRADVHDLLHCVDAFIFPSLQEGLPVALMEAMAAGLPIVCSRIRGNVDLIQENEGGLLCDCHDVQTIADAMAKIRLLDREKLAQHNAEVIKHYDISVVKDEMTAIYGAMLK